MFQNLIISYWDLLFSRELEIPSINTNGILVKNMTVLFFYLVFVIFLLTYLYCYTRSLKGLFPTFPGYGQKLIDSVAFWLQIKTPNMKFGKDKKN